MAGLGELSLPPFGISILNFPNGDEVTLARPAWALAVAAAARAPVSRRRGPGG